MALGLAKNAGTGFLVIKTDLMAVEAMYSAAMAGQTPRSMNGKDIEQAAVSYLQNLVARTVDDMGLTSKDSN